MNHISCSVVLYNPDYLLLDRVVSSVVDAFLVIKDRWSFSIDFVSNDGDCENKELIKILDKYSSKNFYLRILNPSRNVGYGSGNNLSIFSNRNSIFHLVLNPDVILTGACLFECVNFMESNPSVSLLTPKVLDFDNNIQYLCKRNPTLIDMIVRAFDNKFINYLFKNRISYYSMLDFDYQKNFTDVEYPTGCFMFFKYSDLIKVKGFDERYFLHYEDADIGRKISIISNICYVASVVILHKWTRDSHKTWKSRLITVKSGLVYISKWGGLFY